MIKNILGYLWYLCLCFICYLQVAFKSNLGMARVSGPLFSMSASGSVGDVLTYATWKGLPYCREWFTPTNPQTSEQVNMRTALTLAVAYWQTPLAGPTVTAYNTGALGLGMSGFNLYMQRALDAYITQITVAVTPNSVVVADVYPDDVFTWT